MKTRGRLVLISILLTVCCALVMLSGCQTTVVNRQSGQEGRYDVRKFGAAGDGRTDDSEAIKACIQAAQVSNVVFPCGTYRITQNLSIPDTAELVFEEGAALLLEEGIKVELSGLVKAGNAQIFKGTGDISGISGQAVGNPMWFGAAGDGKTDDTAAFQKAVDSFQEVKIPASAKGYVLSGIILNRRMRLSGAENEKAVLIAAENAGDILTVRSSGVEISDLSFKMANTASACIYFDTSAKALEQNRVSGILAEQACCVVKDHGGNMVITTTFEDFDCRKGRGTAFTCNNMWGFIFLKNIRLDYSQSDCSINFPALTVKKNAGMILNNVQVIGSTNSTSEAHGFVTDESEAIWWQNCTVTNVGGYGFRHTGSVNQHQYFQDCSVKNAASGGFYFDGNGRYLQLDGCSAEGGSTGFRFAPSCRYAQLSNATVKGATGSGIHNQAAYSSIWKVTAENCGQYGVQSSAEGCTVVNVQGKGNRQGLYSISGDGSGITSCP